MGLSRDSYIELMKNLLPKGIAWNRGAGSVFHKLFEAVADELVRLDTRLEDIVDESDPRSADELIVEWERVVGLPDECEGTFGETLAARRNAVVRKLTAQGGQTPQFFIDLAAYVGFTVTITEFDPFVAGDPVGDPLTNSDAWGYTFQVNGSLDEVQYFLAGSGAAGDPLATWESDRLECVIDRAKPAHTNVIYSYT